MLVAHLGPFIIILCFTTGGTPGSVQKIKYENRLGLFHILILGVAVLLPTQNFNIQFPSIPLISREIDAKFFQNFQITSGREEALEMERKP